MSVDCIIHIVFLSINLILVGAACIKIIREEKITKKRATDFLRSELEIANELYEKETGKPMFDIEREVSQLHYTMKF